MTHQRVPRKEDKNRGYDMRCPDCGKLSYRSRAAAKLAARRGQSRGLVVTRVYQCGDYWHMTSQDAATATWHRSRGPEL